MILKKRWIDVINENCQGNEDIGQQGLVDLVNEVDSLFTLTYKDSGNDYRLSNLFNRVIEQFFTKENDEKYNIWFNMPIFISSYNFKDRSPFGELVLRLTQYLGFYKKILTDNGLARSVITHREYDNRGNSDGTTKSYNSETPQIELTNFDDAIKFASSLAKNEDLTHSRTYGDSDLTVSSKSWDEEEKNLKYIFYNDLCDFIRKMPQWIYAQYSLDSMPTYDIVKETFNYFKDLYERR